MPDVPAVIIDSLPDCRAVEETHISWVLLTDRHAYKVKKPVTLPFLDYGSVDKRRACCLAELRLNRRFAPDLYLEVVELATASGNEPAVKMHRFPEEARLDHVCARGELTNAQLSQFARALVAFQSAAAVSSAPTVGAPAAILADALENFAELERLLPAATAPLATLKAWTLAEHTRHEDDFARRKARGFIREGHGDLHLGNLVLLDGRITPFDGIEFNEGFRWIDVASEIAFTLLDLLDHGRPGLATWLLSEWLVWSGDFAALDVLRFYLVYRAMVRAKVAALRANGGAAAEAANYLAMAQQLTVPPVPTLTLTCGPSGCGKTYATDRRLAGADFLDTVRIRSDVERKRLYGLAPDAASGGTIYSPVATLRTYAQLAETAEQALLSGWSVIVDAAFLRRAERNAFRALATRLGVPCTIIAPTATPAELHRRIAARRGDASEATAAVLDRQLAWFEPPDADAP